MNNDSGTKIFNQRVQAARHFIREQRTKGEDSILCDELTDKLNNIEQMLRSGGNNTNVYLMFGEIENIINNTRYSQEENVFQLLLQVRRGGIESKTLNSETTGAKIDKVIGDLINLTPINGSAAPKEINTLGGYITFNFKMRDASEGNSALSCLRLALYLAAEVNEISISAALFRCTSGSHETTRKYIEILQSYSVPTMILAPQFENNLPEWCRGPTPAIAADRLNKCNPFFVSGISGEQIGSPNLSYLEFKAHRSAENISFYLVTAKAHKDNRELFIESEPLAVPRIEFLQPDKSYDPTFVDQIANASEAQILGMTNENLSEALEAVAERRMGKPLRTLTIVFASEQIAHLIPAVDGLAVPHRLRRAAGLKIIQHMRNSLGDKLAQDFEIRETLCPLPFVGVRTREVDCDWHSRIGLIVPNRRNKNRPYIDVPRGTFGHAIDEAFEFYVSRSRPILSRLVVGTVKKDGELEFLIPKTLHDKTSITAMPNGCVEANVLIIIYKKFVRRGNQLVLQLRTQFNSDDSIGKLSNLSARVTESDCYNFSDGATGTSPHEDSDEAFDQILQILKIDADAPLPDNVFINAAIRECHAGLGLLPGPDAFYDHGSRSLHHQDSNGRQHHRFFKILSLGLETDEISNIIKTRRHANLQTIEVNSLHIKELNTFLKTHLTDVFKPIFSELKIS